MNLEGTEDVRKEADRRKSRQTSDVESGATHVQDSEDFVDVDGGVFTGGRILVPGVVPQGRNIA